jgi:hypothetical protein
MAQRASELLRLARSLDPNGFRQLLAGADLTRFLDTGRVLYNGMDELSHQRQDALLRRLPG